MSGKWPGGVISKTAPTVTGPTDGEGGSASGIWTLDQAADYEKQGLWPKPLIPRELWGVGANWKGPIGDGSETARSSPVQIGALTDWIASAGGAYHSIFKKSDGTLWATGRNNFGQLGQGNTTDVSSPVQIGALTNWLTIACMYGSSFAVKTDGTLWAWGQNNFGQLGQGDTTNRSSPVQIGALTTWAEVCGGEQNMAMAVKTDGTLWSWGANSAGQLGLGNTTNYSSPKQVGALATWSKVTAIGSASLSLKTDGTLWAWGYNAQGQLGQGNTTNTSSPVQVGGLTNWSAIANSVGGSVFALKTDGTLWAWGGNPYGELGTNNTTYYSSPVQIGALTTWSKVAGGSRTGQAIKTDGTLWTWGRNASGQLGQGNTTDYSSPVQIGALTTWSVLGNQNTSTTVHFIKTP